MGARHELWVHVKWHLRVLKSCAFLMGMSVLDIRDLWYKLTWVGPYDSFAFSAGSRGSLLPAPLRVAVASPPSLNQSEYASGWPSYLSRCDALTPFCSPGSTFFLSAMGTNCRVGVRNETKAIAQLVMTSNVRSDSMAWGACQLLYDHRKPTICQQPIVGHFLARYHMHAEAVPREWLAPVDSAAEEELLRFLDLIAQSHPKHKVVCTGGFAYTQPGRYNPRIFGCASPNLFRAEFVGVYAHEMHRFAFDKAWLTTIDVMAAAGIEYNIRQNTINYFDMDEATVTRAADGATTVALSVTETTANNFVSRGLLYVLMVVIDVFLLLAQMYTGVELVAEWIVPVMRKKDREELEQEIRGRLDDDIRPRRVPSPHDDVSFSKEEYTSSLSTSLYRHRVVVFLTIVTQSISWGIIIPNSVIWTWSLSQSAKLQAFLGSLRLWTLILISVNALWDTVVFCFEARAYAFARATYVSAYEVIAAGVICAYCKSADVMAISEIKFGLEHQRVNDVVSFPGYIAHANTFNPDLDGRPYSQTQLLRIMYMPLVEIILWSVLGVFLWLVAKLAIYYVLGLPAVTSRVAVAKTALGLKGAAISTGASAAGSHKRRMNSAHFQDPLLCAYRREPLEKMLNIPMRARSLVRPTLSMQKVVNGEVMIRPPVHLDFGVFIRDRVVTARSGFRSTMRAVMHLPSRPAPRTTHMCQMVVTTTNAPNFADIGELRSPFGVTAAATKRQSQQEAQANRLQLREMRQTSEVEMRAAVKPRL